MTVRFKLSTCNRLVSRLTAQLTTLSHNEWQRALCARSAICQFIIRDSWLQIAHKLLNSFIYLLRTHILYNPYLIQYIFGLFPVN